MTNPLKIGTIVYSVHDKHAHTGLKNGKIIVGRVKSYQNVDGEIHPIIKEIGANRFIDIEMYTRYNTLETAIDAITTGKKYKKG